MRTIAVTRLFFGPEVNIQPSSNLVDGLVSHLVDAGINDFGGISSITMDFVNPEAPWPLIDRSADCVRAYGHMLVQLLPLYNSHNLSLDRWSDRVIHREILAICVK